MTSEELIAEKDRHIANLRDALAATRKEKAEIAAACDLARAEAEHWNGVATALARERSMQIFWAVFLAVSVLVLGILALVMSNCK